MVAPAVRSSFDVAFWFVERARLEDTYLQSQKLQCLLYLAQGIYASSYYGRMLMPAVFLASDHGPVEPNVASIFQKGRPSGFAPKAVNPEIEFFLNDIWRSYGAYPADKLCARIQRHRVVSESRQIGLMEEIPFSLIRDHFKVLRQQKTANTRDDRQKEQGSSDVVKSADGRVFPKWKPRSIGKSATKKGIWDED